MADADAGIDRLFAQAGFRCATCSTHVFPPTGRGRRPKPPFCGQCRQRERWRQKERAKRKYAVPAGPYAFTCLHCGQAAVRYYRGSGVIPSLCSNACKKAAYVQRHPDRVREREQERERRRAAMVRFCACGATIGKGERKCASCRTPPKPYVPQVKTLTTKCGHCQKAFTQTTRKSRPAGFCSSACRAEGWRRVQRIGKRVREARLRGVGAERVDPIIVFERDGWRCQLCGQRTPKKLRGLYDPRSPELDHIVPLALGGEHSYRNTQCACRSCNGAKGSRPLGQLRLIA